MRESYNFRGKWIKTDVCLEDRGAPVFKKEFELTEIPESAQMYICGLGLFEARINGKLPDDSVLNPNHTQYSQRVLYLKYNIAPLLKEGKNEITVEVGNSFYNETVKTWKWDEARWRDVPKMICDIVFSGGEDTVTIVSDESWLVTKCGNITENSIYYGETHDYTRKDFLWEKPQIADAPEGELSPQYTEPMRRIAEFSPLEITALGNSTYIIKAPEMTTGWAKIRMNIPYGEKMTVTYGETLTPAGKVVHIGKGEGRDGNWYPDGYIQQDMFIGDGTLRDFEPRFSYKGFRYIQIDNCPAMPDENNIFIYKIANDVEEIADFHCSEPLINDLHALMKRTILNNLQGKPTDTPVWEKNGWLGDLNCGLLSMMYNYNLKNFLEGFQDTLTDCFREYTGIPEFAPISQWKKGYSPVWDSVFVFQAEKLLDFYGEKEYVEEMYPCLKDYALQYIELMKGQNWLWGTRGLADWVAPMNDELAEYADPNSSEGAEICSTAFVYQMLRSMCRIAEYMGKEDDISAYTEASEKICDSFNKAFYRKEKGYYQTNFWVQRGQRTRYRQTSNLLPLAFGMVPNEYKEKVLLNLVEDIEEKDFHLDTGCTGTKFILPVLFDNGYGQLAYKILTQTTYPSWGYWLKEGTDSAWESWEKSTRSLDHYFLATYEETLFTHLAGITNVKNGFSEFDFKPHTDCGLEWLKLKIKTPRGIIKCSWSKKDDGTTDIDLTVPDGVKVNKI